MPSVLDLGTRQSFFFIFFLLFLSHKKYFTSLPSAKKKTLGKPPLCRVFFLTLGKPPFCRVFFLPSVFSAALGKELVCRVPKRIHSANIKTLGKVDVSGSDACKIELEQQYALSKKIEASVDRRNLTYFGDQ